jgi:hypothetical protein
MTKLFTATLAVMSLMLTACAQTVGVTIPDGAYYTTHGHRPDYVIIKDGAVVGGSDYDGTAVAFTKDDIMRYSDTAKGFAVVTPTGWKEYCSADTIPTDRIAQLAKDAVPGVPPIYAKCSARHGWDLMSD